MPMDLSAIAGQWFIPNPDKGQPLSGRLARLIIGGQYRIDVDGRVAAQFELRGDAGLVERLALFGEVSAVDRLVVSLILDGEIRETFEFVDHNTLRRRSSNIGTEEKCIDLILQKRFLSLKPSMPSILFNAMPESCANDVGKWLADGLNMEETKVAAGLFPNDIVIRERFDRFARGGRICRQHLPATDLNIRFIANREPRMIVHLREPRQATVSWVFRLDSFHKNQDKFADCRLALEAVSPLLPAGYFEMPFEERLAYQVKTYLPQLVNWTNGWVAAARSRQDGISVLFTTAEDFERQPEQVIKQILAHYEIPETQFDWSRKPRLAMETRFQKGGADHWDTVFKPEQKAFADDLLSPALAEAFAWAA